MVSQYHGTAALPVKSLHSTLIYAIKTERKLATKSVHSEEKYAGVQQD